MREQVSLLLDHGHRDARGYPLGLLSEEAEIVIARLNKAEATRAGLLKMAVGSLLSEEVGRKFREVLDGLNEE